MVGDDAADPRRGVGADDHQVAPADRLRGPQELRGERDDADRPAGTLPGGMARIADRLGMAQRGSHQIDRRLRQVLDGRNEPQDAQRAAEAREPAVERFVGEVPLQGGDLLRDQLVEDHAAHPASLVQEVRQVDFQRVDGAADASLRQEHDLRIEQLSHVGVGQPGYGADARMSGAFGDDHLLVGERCDGLADAALQGPSQRFPVSRLEVGAGESRREPNRREVPGLESGQGAEHRQELHVLVHVHAVAERRHLLAHRLDVADRRGVQHAAELGDDAQAGDGLAGVLPVAGEVDDYRSHGSVPRSAGGCMPPPVAVSMAPCV